MLVGVSLASAFLGRPLILLFGLVYRRVFGEVGNLATENSLRNPRRTAATASALMIGLALMSLMAVFGASASASTQSTIEQVVTSQYIISNVIGQPFSPDIAAQVGGPGRCRVGGLDAAGLRRRGRGGLRGRRHRPSAFGVALALPAEEGSLQDLRDGAVAVDAGTAPRRATSEWATPSRSTSRPGSRSSRWWRCSRPAKGWGSRT